MTFLKTAFAALALLTAGTSFAQDDLTSPDTSETASVSETQPETVSADATEAASEPDTGKIAWMMVSISFVLMMTCPGLALFYGGLVRKKNIVSVLMQCVFLMGLMTTLWVTIGYSLAFGGDDADGSPYIGNFEHAFLAGVSPGEGTGTAADVVDDQIVVAFQGMFFIITPALICGAFAERMKFSSMALFCALWGLLIYCPIAHWVWANNGWLCEWNTAAPFRAIDFAGGLVVHISSGVAALVCALVIGSRRGFPAEPMPPHNLTYTCIGAGLLWMGWFGFNAGSAVAADGRAVNALLATHCAAAAGVLGWSLMEFIKHGKAGILGACSGAVAGLVCITPASGSVTPMAAVIMGIAAGVFCFLCCTTLKNALGYDDSLDAFGVHGAGGTLGAILTGVFATRWVTGGEEAVGMLDGNTGQLVPQLVSIAAAAAFSAVGTYVLLLLVKAILGLRPTEQEEITGLDESQHGEHGYIFN